MKIIIFGAGGGIGKHAVTHALNKGYEVTAYLRNPEKLTARAENLTVVKGEITDYAWMKIAISGCDAVVWCIGVNGDGAALAGHKLLIKAMKETGVKRLVDYGTPSYHFEKDQKSMTTWFPGFFAGLAFKDSKKRNHFHRGGCCCVRAGLDICALHYAYRQGVYGQREGNIWQRQNQLFHFPQRYSRVYD